jgi:hypothetical protein
MGEPGLDLVLQVIDDPESQDLEKELAGLVAILIPHKRTLEALLFNSNFMEMGAGERLGRIEFQLARLPTTDVAPFAAEIRQLAQSQPEEKKSESVLALLAEMGL